MNMMSSNEIPIVSLGGGHGLYATILAMRKLSREVTAIVTVADDGGSSGRIRSELGVVPPGDLRMAVAALLTAAQSEQTNKTESADPQLWAELLQYRFGGQGALAGHPVGNMLLAGLTEYLDDPVKALAELLKLFSVAGNVLPMSTVPLEIEADVVGLEADPRISRAIRGQVAVAVTPGQVRRVRLVPESPPACVEAIAAIEQAELITLGPGSWFSSVIPHVLVPNQLAALQRATAKKVLFVNLAAEPGETTGFSVERHLHVLHAHAEKLKFDAIVVDSESVPHGRTREHLIRAAQLFESELIEGEIKVPGQLVHDPEKVAALMKIIVNT